VTDLLTLGAIRQSFEQKGVLVNADQVAGTKLREAPQ
jgi:hypothetical protein